MVILANKAPRHANAIDLGIAEGVGADPVANRNRLLSVIEDGYSVLFPAGLFLFSSQVDPENVHDIVLKGVGPATVLRNVSTGVRFFYFKDCENVQVSDLRIEGNAWSGDLGSSVWAPQETSNQNNAGVAVYRSRNVRLERLDVSGVPGSAIHVEGCYGVHITNNRCTGNEGNEAGVSQSGADIRVSDNDLQVPNWGAALPDMGRQVIITGNQCFSNSHLGIDLVEISTSITVANNQVIAFTSPDLTQEADTIATNRRKEAIVLAYDTDEEDAASGRNEHEITCTGNIIRSCGWSGIYINSNQVTASNPGGVMGTVADNLIVNTCLQNSAAIEDWKRNAITIEQTRDITVVGNMIRKVNAAGTAVAHGGILYALTSAFTPKEPDPNAKRSRAVIANNNISDVEGFGIYVANDVNEVIVEGNVVQETTDRMFGLVSRSQTTPEARLGECTISGNRFVSSVLEDGLAGVLIANDNGESTFVNNVVDVSEHPTYGDGLSANLMQVNNGSNVKISGNSYQGNSTNLLRLLRIDDLATNAKLTECRVSDNTFKNAAIGLWTDDNGGATDAYYVDEGNRFINISVRNRQNQGDVRAYPGRTLEADRVEIYVDDEADKPTTAHLAAGDHITILNEQTHGLRGWHHDGTDLKGLSKEFLNADQYGAPSDGGDIVPALNLMIADGVAKGVNRFIIPSRTYAWGSTLTLPRSTTSDKPNGLLIEGNQAEFNVAQGVTAIERPWTDNNSGERLTAFTPHLRGMNFYGFDPSQTSGNPTSSGVDLRNMAGASMEDCYFEDMAEAVRIVFGLWTRLKTIHAKRCDLGISIESGQSAGVLNLINKASSNVTTLENCRVQTFNTSAIGMRFRQSSNLAVNNCIVEGSDVDVCFDIDDADTPGGGVNYLTTPSINWNQCWVEFTGACNRVMRADTRDGRYWFNALQFGSGMNQASGLFELVDNVVGTRVKLSMATFEGTLLAAPPTQKWFIGNPGNSNANRWIFEDNYINDPGGAVGITDFDDPDLWAPGGTPEVPTLGTGLILRDTYYRT